MRYEKAAFALCLTLLVAAASPVAVNGQLPSIVAWWGACWIDCGHTEVQYNYDSEGDYQGKEEHKFGYGGKKKRYACKDVGGGQKECVSCKGCHASAPRATTSEQETIASISRHETVYLPRAVLRVSAGERIPWGGNGRDLALSESALTLFDSQNRPRVVFPQGSQVLKDSYGRPNLVHWLSETEPRNLVATK